MIKQIIIENLYNFKSEIVIDFVNDKTGTYHIYHDDSIGNITILYGKNNVGKSNFFKVLMDVKKSVMHNEYTLKPYFPVVENVPSFFQIEFETQDHQYVYGFKTLVSEKTILDEYLYIDDKLAYKQDEASLQCELMAYKKQGDTPMDVVYDLFEKISYVSFLTPQTDSLLKTLNELLFVERKQAIVEVVNALLKTADLEIRGISLGDEGFVFEHNTGAMFPYELLSSGTKQLLKISLTVLKGMEGLILIDEIEAGLHFDLVEVLMDFISLLSEIEPETQFIISTHREDLLDIENISNENKVFMTLENQQIQINYLSNYYLNADDLPSKRYRLDAFDVNPNTSRLYDLKHAILNLRNVDNNNET
ncbi:MAG TPA: AAA family ATPase [Erysipelothrix sp.]|nr:AAA family ATPase [Erysipelothrix sp.]